MMSRWVVIIIGVAWVSYLCWAFECEPSVSGKEINSFNRFNILFIAVDDLNDWIGAMGGHPQAQTPNIDRLAKHGALFTNAHCQAPICGPSRASVMTGLMPTSTGNYLQLKDKDILQANDLSKKAIFLPDYLEQYGYKTMGVGKIYHDGDGANTFDEYGGVFEKYGPKPECRLNYDPRWYAHKTGNTSTDWGVFPDFDEQMPDSKSASWAIDQLKKKHGNPFFLAVGFVRPHVPWTVPQKWFDFYPLDSIDTPPYLGSDMEDVPPFGKKVTEAPMMPTTEELIEQKQWKNAVQAYLACMTFVDAQIGKVLDALKKSDYANNTIVVLWSDHGYHLGEKNRFAKQALWQRATKSVLIIDVPGRTDDKVSSQPVQLLDIYPTLLELVGLPKNAMNEGHSLVPLLQNTPAPDWDYYAITAYGKENVAVTGEKYRLIQYQDGSQEFYDLEQDPNEWNNLANHPVHRARILEFQKQIPEVQASYSNFTRYTFNKYFEDITSK